MHMSSTQSENVPWWYFDFTFPDSPGVFSYEDWSRHRSWLRFWWQPKTFLLALGNMLPVLLWVTLITIFVTLYYQLGQKQHEDWVVLVSKDYNQPFILTSFALALLLVFRTNSAYEVCVLLHDVFGISIIHCKDVQPITCATMM